MVHWLIRVLLSMCFHAGQTTSSRRFAVWPLWSGRDIHDAICGGFIESKYFINQCRICLRDKLRHPESKVMESKHIHTTEKHTIPITAINNSSNNTNTNNNNNINNNKNTKKQKEQGTGKVPHYGSAANKVRWLLCGSVVATSSLYRLPTRPRV